MTSQLAERYTIVYGKIISAPLTIVSSALTLVFPAFNFWDLNEQ